MRQRGFSLLEILVAFSILALSLGVLMQIFAGATRNADLARNQSRATTLALSLLAESNGEPILAQTENHGTSEDGFRWYVRTSPFDDPGDNEEATANTKLILWKIAVEVGWGDEGSPSARSIGLAMLRTRPRQAP
jgi:general secretion pathway protein I